METTGNRLDISFGANTTFSLKQSRKRQHMSLTGKKNEKIM